LNPAAERRRFHCQRAYIGTSRRFAAGGYSVCIARRDPAKSSALVEELTSAGGRVHALSVDARRENEVQELCERVEREVGPIEVCLFNAGSNVKKSLHETSDKLFFKAWELACFAGFLVGREATRHMLKRGRGTMLFTGATASVRGSSGFAAFSAAKFGLRAVAQAMARELGPQNIHVAHLVIDSGVDTAWVRERIKEREGAEAVANLAPDRLMRPEAVAEAYWALYSQPRDAWSSEMEIRPFGEKW